MTAFQKILRGGRKPYKLQSDKGTEFTNRNFQRLLRDNDIVFFTTNNETKASVVERFNKTLKEKMWKYFTSKNTHKYVDVLSRLVSAYNRKKHSSIGKAPIEVKPSNENETWLTLYGNKPAKSHKKAPFRIGDKVRLSAATRAFRKGYLPKWTEEIFTVSRIIKRSPLVYKVSDYDGEPIEGTFYAEELQKVIPPRDDMYKIERILHSRKRGGVTEHFVKWRGYPDKFNSYVTDIVHLR